MTTAAMPSTDLPAEAAAPAARAAAWAVPVAAAVMLASQAPLLWKFFVDLWARPQYEFFPLLLLAVPFVGAACLRDMPTDALRPGRRSVGITLFAIAWLCLATGGVMYMRWFAPVSAWLMLAGGVWLLGGARLARALWPVGALLLLVVPPPGQNDEYLLIVLRRLAVTCAGRLLDVLQVPTFVHGAVIDVPGDRLMVEEACSGINSMLAVLAFTVLLAFWKRLPVASLLMLLPTAFVYVFWANVARITVCAAAKVWWGIDLLTGAPHELLGVALFVGSMALVFSTERAGQWLMNWDGDDDEPAAAPSTASGPATAPRRGDAALWITAAAVFLATGAAVAVRTWPAWPASILPAANAFQLPIELAGWTRVDDKDRAPERAEVSGRQSRLWQYRRGATLASVGVDYPFSGYHDATICYRLAGWDVTDMAEREVAGDGPARFDVAMHRPPLSQGMMAFALCDESGAWWRRPPPVSESFVGHAVRLSRKKALSPPLAQLQVLNVGYAPPTASERDALGALFDAAAAETARQIKGFRAAAATR